ncbi:MAG TPA: polymer-forming cytoskeletal protein [Chloroflexota bacterium]|jgi:cytoskeletal protein CcmA (bactofilin family)
MFKKSDEQEWTRFRGALSKDRDETGAAPAVPDASDPTIGSTAGPPISGQGANTPANVRSANDVNVGVPTARPRGMDNEVESLIGEHTTFEGTLKTEGPVRLLGTIQGEIESKSTIIVEEKAHVTARLTAQQVTVAGQLDGQIYCEGRVEIRPTGRVTGEINAGALIVQEGAYFDGSSRMASGGAHAPGHPAATSASASAGGTGSSGSGMASGGFASRMAATEAASARQQ